MEYTDDVEDAPDGSLEQAIEYCNSEQMGNWLGTEGAVEWIRGVILRALNSSSEGNTSGLNRVDLEWEEKLTHLENQYEKNKELSDDIMTEGEEKKFDDCNEEENSHPSEVDLLMFTGMFRTGMDMLSDAGDLAKLS
jgi:hypothetical protein